MTADSVGFAVFNDPETFGAVRDCEHNEGISYRAVMEAHGVLIVTKIVAAAREAGSVCHDQDASHDGHFAWLELLDADGDLIDDYCIPTAAAWEWWRRAIELRAVSSDCPVCEPTAYTATYPGEDPS